MDWLLTAPSTPEKNKSETEQASEPAVETPAAVEPVKPAPQVEAPTTRAPTDPPPAPEPKSPSPSQRKEPRQIATDPKPDPPSVTAAETARTSSSTANPDDTEFKVRLMYPSGGGPPVEARTQAVHDRLKSKGYERKSKSQEQLDAADASLGQPLKPRPGTTTNGASAYGDLPPVEALRKEAVDIVGFLDTSRRSIAEHQRVSNVRRERAEESRQLVASSGFFTFEEVNTFLGSNPQMKVTMKQLEAEGYDSKNPFASRRLWYETDHPRVQGSMLVQNVYDAMRDRQIAQARSLEQKASAHEQRARDIERQVERNRSRLAEIRQVTAGFVGPEQPQPLNEAQKRIASAVTDVDRVLSLVLQLPPSSKDLGPEEKRDAALETARGMLEREGLGKYVHLLKAKPEDIRAILAGFDNLNKAYSFDKPSRQPSATDRIQEEENRQSIMDSISRR
jgi:hypothetical protein